ncbi:MAG TPA: pilus assembly protein PilM [Tepidisphaeraceae bacterium]|nr:pilus assembly protein PilM [Tepidisphaeraceae bacterium]
MIRLTRSQIQPIGLDIGFDSIKMLQLETVGQSLSVIAAARQQLPEDVRAQPQLRMPLAVDMIRKMLRQGGFIGRQVITSLPREIVHVKNLRLPMIPPHELAAAIEFEARNIFPFDTDQAHVEHCMAGEVRQGADVRQELIVLAARNADVNDFVEQLHCSGAVIASLDVEPFALYRTIERFIRRREDEADVHVLVDVGARRSQVIIGRGREISFLKPIEIGSRHMHEAVSAKLGITFDEARALRRRLAEAGPLDPIEAAKSDPVRQAVFDAGRSAMEDLGREISLCLRYFSVTFRGQRPEKVRLVGGEACDPQLHSVLNTALPIPVEASRPLFSVDTSRMKASERRGTMSEWSLALGLGLRQAMGTFGARDGKPRDPFALREDLIPLAPKGEVVDLNAAVSATSAGSPAGATAIAAERAATAATRRPPVAPPPQEVARA